MYANELETQRAENSQGKRKHAECDKISCNTIVSNFQNPSNLHENDWKDRRDFYSRSL